MADDMTLSPWTRRQFLKLGLSAGVTVSVPLLVACTNPTVPPTQVSATAAPGQTVLPSATTVAATADPPSATTVAATADPPSPTPVNASVTQPKVISSQNGVLATSLLIKLHPYTVAGKSVNLRSYGSPKTGIANPDPNNDDDWDWSFPAPTLRLNGGDRLQIKLYNYLPVEENVGVCEPEFYPPTLTPPNPDTYPNCFHENNGTNLHFHGMHVPQGPGADDVFLSLYPQGQTVTHESHGDSGTTAIGEFDFDFVIPATHPQGTFWYHPHKHGATDL